MDERLQNRIKKLQVLAERGIGGEKIGAKAKLDELMKKYDISLADVEEDKVDYYVFSCSKKYLKRLLRQCILRVLDDVNTSLYKPYRTRNAIGVYCTVAQRLEILLDFEFYTNLFESELDLFMAAFIRKQDLYPSNVKRVTVSEYDISAEEYKHLLKLEAYMSNISKKSRALGIERKTN